MPLTKSMICFRVIVLTILAMASVGVFGLIVPYGSEKKEIFLYSIWFVWFFSILIASFKLARLPMRSFSSMLVLFLIDYGVLLILYAIYKAYDIDILISEFKMPFYISLSYLIYTEALKLDKESKEQQP